MYVSCFLSNNLEEQLFQIAHCYYYEYKYNKKIVFIDTTCLIKFDNLITEEEFKNITFNFVLEDDNYIPENHDNNICLIGHFKYIKYIDENVREYMRSLIFNNKQDMFEASNIFNSIKTDLNDNNINNYTFLSINDYTENYKYINNILNKINIDNIIIISNNKNDRLVLNKNLIFLDNIYNNNVKIIVMSFMNNGIIDDNNLLGWWGAILSVNNNNIYVSENFNKKLYLSKWIIN